MDQEKNKSRALTATIFTTILLLSSVGQAALYCSFFISVSQKQPTNPLTALQEQIRQAESLEEANSLTYELASLGNLILDQAVDGMIHVNRLAAENQPFSNQQVAQVQALLQMLQNSFQIPDLLFSAALSNRLQIESLALSKKIAAAQKKRAIGFGRDESSADFHADPPAKNPIGFVLHDSATENDLYGGSSFKLIIEHLGLQLFNQKNDASTVKEPIGFIHPKKESESEDQTKPDQIGFVRTEKRNESFTTDDVIQIALNIQSGEFSLIDRQTKKSIGF